MSCSGSIYGNLIYVSPGVWVAVNALGSHNTNTFPKQTHRIAIDVSINSCGRFYKIYCSNIECPIIREVYRSPESMQCLALEVNYNKHFQGTSLCRNVNKVACFYFQCFFQFSTLRACHR